MALTRNGKRVMAHLLGGGIGATTWFLYNRNNSGVNISNIMSYAFAYGNGTSLNYGMYLYVGYGETPSDRLLDINIYARYMANETKLPATTTTSLDSGINTVSFVITNDSTIDTRTYNRYGMMLSYSPSGYSAANTYILSYYDLPEPITLAPGESKTVELTFNVNNI